MISWYHDIMRHIIGHMADHMISFMISWYLLLTAMARHNRPPRDYHRREKLASFPSTKGATMWTSYKFGMKRATGPNHSHSCRSFFGFCSFCYYYVCFNKGLGFSVINVYNGHELLLLGFREKNHPPVQACTFIHCSIWRLVLNLLDYF